MLKGETETTSNSIKTELKSSQKKQQNKGRRKAIIGIGNGMLPKIYPLRKKISLFSSSQEQLK